MLMLPPWLKSLALLVAGRGRSDRETVCHRSGARGGDGIGDGDRLSAADVKRAHPQIMGFIGALGKGGDGRARCVHVRNRPPGGGEQADNGGHVTGILCTENHSLEGLSLADS